MDIIEDYLYRIIIDNINVAHQKLKYYKFSSSYKTLNLNTSKVGK